MVKLFLKTILFSFLLLSFVRTVHAQDYITDYKVEYFLSENTGSVNAAVKVNVKITNLKEDIYVKKFSLIFPRSFKISNIQASDDNGAIKASLEEKDQDLRLDLEFSNPKTGINSVNNFYINFNQKNLFVKNGNIWEVIVPVIENKDGAYEIVVNLPSDTDKKIAIAKPKPDFIRGNRIFWNNPKSKTIYAVFGERQFYRAKLKYSLKNTRLGPVYTEIAFPPDTLFQKIYINSINPAPDEAYQDEDGNYIGKYVLKPREQRDIFFDGFIELTTKPRPEVQIFQRTKIEEQKNYLLTAKKYWNVRDVDRYAAINNAYDIYNFIVNNFKYAYHRVSQPGNRRIGASEALRNPQDAVCLEFSDTFVALAREKGIMSREIQGYGITNDEQLRPLSLVNDVLHSWPEYFSPTEQLWKPVDPTWENTSGIDYFNSFDLNHVVLAIHGKDPEYPLPAGLYKTGESRDIDIIATDKLPITENRNVILEQFKIASKILRLKSYSGRIIVQNLGNSYVWSPRLEVIAKNLEINNLQIQDEPLAPLEKREISFDYLSRSSTGRDGSIDVLIDGNVVGSEKIRVLPFSQGSILTVLIFVVSIAGGVSAIIFVRRRLTGIRN